MSLDVNFFEKWLKLNLAAAIHKVKGLSIAAKPFYKLVGRRDLNPRPESLHSFYVV
jgi:hypothetical protein